MDFLWTSDQFIVSAESSLIVNFFSTVLPPGKCFVLSAELITAGFLLPYLDE